MGRLTSISDALTESVDDRIDLLHARIYERAESLWRKRAYQRWGMAPITAIDAQDVIIAGYPKSGNTWFQNLLSGLVYGMDPRYTSDSMVQNLIPDLDVYEYYRRYGTPTFFKSHSFPQPEFRRVVYLLRDGRDVMVSYYHYLVAQYGERFSFQRLVTDGDDKGHRWNEHVDTWMANPYGADILVIKYEDLRRDGVRELQRLCAFTGRQEDDALLASVCERASFQNMREKEKWDRWDHRQWWPRDQHFVRRGKIGSYQDEMPPEVLDAFLEQATSTLRKCGYLEEPMPKLA